MIEEGKDFFPNTNVMLLIRSIEREKTSKYRKVKHDLAVSFLGTYPREMKTWTSSFMVA